jgi:hypothetical protein
VEYGSASYVRIRLTVNSLNKKRGQKNVLLTDGDGRGCQYGSQNKGSLYFPTSELRAVQERQD